ncbi:MAG: type I restriction endonuclease subunit R [Bryobacterales bacterium]|nr:type I restriction endonuclease subunit R [Bryobacterales bacterium]
MTYKPDSEDAAIEQPTIALFAELGWETVNAYSEIVAPYGGPPATLGRETTADVLLTPRLRTAVNRLNPQASPNAIEIAIQQLAQDRGVMSLVRANQAVYRLLKDGARVSTRHGAEEEETIETIRLIDWDQPENNDFLLASQFWVSGDYGTKRVDLLGFVNGIPLVLLELKASHVKLELAYQKNLTDYRDTIPQLFWYNAFIILSNGSGARLGSLTAGFEHFAEWKKIDNESEPGIIRLETMIRGTCEPRKLLDLMENFTLFDEQRGEPSKLIAKNHQFLGVNNAITAVGRIRQNQGRLGVFWHTQGSGKSYSMVLFSRKVLRKIPGNWTFVIVTDREDLDGQIYRNFANTGALLEDEKRVRADSGESLKRMLNQEDHRYVFTLIQKFHSPDGEPYPVLSTRSDIIVMTDEAHRSQYDIFAANMRAALPNASFIGFTGTPLMADEELTREVFGDYVSIYNFTESVNDANTVPLFYENRIPELQLVNESLSEEMAEIVDEANLSEDQERKLEREFAREYHLITREDRLDRVGEDIAAHYTERGVLAKAMVISIDKATAVRTFDKVRQHWNTAIGRLKEKLEAADPMDRPELEQRLHYFESAEMAVVVSPSQGEIEEFRNRRKSLGQQAAHDAIKRKDPEACGLLDIEFHRKRMVKEDLETRFKDAEDPLRMVFVCAMWITGFDVPSCSTIYLESR